VSDTDDFIEWIQTELRDAEIALHDGDPGPRLAIWSEREPVSVLGAWLTGFGQEDVRRLFETLAATHSDCKSYVYEIEAAQVAGDLAFTAGYERTEGSINGEPRQYALRVTQIYRRENGAWRVAHRHADRVEPVAAA
jgi:ketosteroid isomerase-like protein